MAGGATSATAALVIKVTDNILKKGFIGPADIASIISENPQLVTEVWSWLALHDYIEIEEPQDVPSNGSLLRAPQAHVTDKCSDLKTRFDQTI